MKKITILISDDTHARAVKLTKKRRFERPLMYERIFHSGLIHEEKEQALFETKNQE